MFDILQPDAASVQPCPYFLSAVPAGFPSPADSYIERTLDLNTYLVKHPAATFFLRVQGESMTGAGIHDGDLLIVDRSLEPRDCAVVIACIDGDLTVKRLKKRGKNVALLPENPDFEPITLSGDTSLEIWGVVTSVIHAV